jgi:hypothetical protein
VCDRWAKDIVDHGNFSFRHNQNKIWPIIKRIQINNKPEKISRQFIDALKLVYDKEFIIQVSSFYDSYYEEIKNSGIKCYPLFDNSGGKGKLPENWPNSLNTYCGYAGGLGPDNLESELVKINKVAGNNSIWINIETKVRTDNIFDLNKVEEVLKIVAGYISGNNWYEAILSTRAGRKSTIP